MVVWSAHGYSAVVVASLPYAMHDVAWDPLTAYEFASVGARGVAFWILEEQLGGQQAEIKVSAKTCSLLLLAINL